jgi:hypothetical protein
MLFLVLAATDTDVVINADVVELFFGIGNPSRRKNSHPQPALTPNTLMPTILDLVQ